MALTLPFVACGEPKKAPPSASSGSTTGSTASSAVASAPLAADAPAPTAMGSTSHALPSTVGSHMPHEAQAKAIAAAMRAPQPNDAPLDDLFVKDLQKRLAPIVLSTDAGPEKSKLNRVELVGGGRQIDLLMASGCGPETMTRVVAEGAGVSNAALLSHGVLLLRCDDSQKECLATTRSSRDTFCMSAPSGMASGDSRMPRQNE